MQQVADKPRAHPRPARAPAIIGLLAGLAVNAGVVWAAAGLYDAAHRLPAGTEIRPMGTAVVMGGMTMAGLLLALPFSGLALALSRHYRNRTDAALALAGLLLALLPWPVGAVLIGHVQRMTGITYSH
jgi:hypothetical protein